MWDEPLLSPTRLYRGLWFWWWFKRRGGAYPFGWFVRWYRRPTAEYCWNIRKGDTHV